MWPHVLILYGRSSYNVWSFPDGSAGKECVCNAGDTGDSGLIPRLGTSPGGGNGNQLHSIFA